MTDTLFLLNVILIVLVILSILGLFIIAQQLRKMIDLAFKGIKILGEQQRKANTKIDTLERKVFNK